MRRDRVLSCILALAVAAATACSVIAPNTPDAQGYTRLMRAAEHGDSDTVRSLVRRGADVDHQGRQVVRYSLLWPFKDTYWEDVPVWATNRRHSEVVKTLREAGAKDETPSWARQG